MSRCLAVVLISPDVREEHAALRGTFEHVQDRIDERSGGRNLEIARVLRPQSVQHLFLWSRALSANPFLSRRSVAVFQSESGMVKSGTRLTM